MGLEEGEIPDSPEGTPEDSSTSDPFLYCRKQYLDSCSQDASELVYGGECRQDIHGQHTLAVPGDNSVFVPFLFI